MQPSSQPGGSRLSALPLQDFGSLQARYQPLKLRGRAEAILADADPALSIAEDILNQLAAAKALAEAFGHLRANVHLVGRIRACEAKTMLLDESMDFLAGTRRKLAAWKRTMERVREGEDVVCRQADEYIPSAAPLAIALMGISSIGNYLSIVQLSVAEMARLDAAQSSAYPGMIAEIRRCATVLGDCENAAGICGFIH